MENPLIDFLNSPDLCPRCYTGVDNDHDGDCGTCAGLPEKAVAQMRIVVLLAVGQAMQKLSSPTPSPTRIETAHYYAQPLGASWTVRTKHTGEVVCFRPSHKDAEDVMENLEKRGVFYPQPEI